VADEAWQHKTGVPVAPFTSCRHCPTDWAFCRLPGHSARLPTEAGNVLEFQAFPHIAQASGQCVDCPVILQNARAVYTLPVGLGNVRENLKFQHIARLRGQSGRMPNLSGNVQNL